VPERPSVAPDREVALPTRCRIGDTNDADRAGGLSRNNLWVMVRIEQLEKPASL
jgi:hypothetical protein